MVPLGTSSRLPGTVRVLGSTWGKLEACLKIPGIPQPKVGTNWARRESKRLQSSKRQCGTHGGGGEERLLARGQKAVRVLVSVPWGRRECRLPAVLCYLKAMFDIVSDSILGQGTP